VPDRHHQIAAGSATPIDFSPWESVLERTDRIGQEDAAFAEFFEAHCGDLPPVARTLAIDYVEGFHAADARDLSVRWMLQEETELRDGNKAGQDDGEAGVDRLMSGYDQIVEELRRQAAGAAMHLNAVVHTVHWQHGQVIASVLEQGHWEHTYEAERAIITLPLGILQAPPAECGVAFVPPLTAKRAALAALRMGAVLKVVLWFREPLWKNLATRGFLHLPGRRFMTWWPLDDTGMVTGWSGGPRAASLATESDAAILAAALDEFAAGLGMSVEALRESLCESHVFNWSRDPFAGGAYSYARADGAWAAQELAQPLGGTLFFAGEATHNRLPATVAGALESGYRAAEEALRD
jgi:monoamine oxidase